jgi:3-oxoacyl-[acyl-carrier-protein] synthase II
MLAGARSADEFWNRLRLGESQITVIPELESAGLPTALGARVGGFNPGRELPDLSEEHASRYSREILITMSAAGGALRDAGLSRYCYDPARTGFVDSTSRGPLGWWLQGEGRAVGSATGRALSGLPGSSATMSAIHLNLQGLVTTIANACVGASQALGMAIRELRSGEADVMLVGGHDFPLVPEIVTTLAEMGVLAPAAAGPPGTMRPYDRERAGFVPGEGAVVLCLENLSHARGRGARCYAEVLGQKSLNEAAHPTTMDQSGKVAADLVGQLVYRAGRQVTEIGYVCGHGSATIANDRAECRMVEHLIPDRPCGEWPPLGSVKPVFGHCLGASQAVNIAATALMIYHQTLAPTVNCEQAAPDCPGDHVIGGPRPADVQLAVSMSHALGSQTAAALLGVASW